MTGLTVFIAISLAANVALLVALIARPRASGAEAISERLAGYEKRLDRQDAALREEFSRNRMELTATFTRFSGLLEQKLAAVQESVHASGKAGREELTLALKSFEGRVESMREAVERRLTDIQQDNAAKLERMRETVDEKLHKTLETRLGESFKLVSERLELVQKGLGEMQTLANGVGDLKKVLSNVKTKGVLGEYQLGAILDQMLTRGQYERNVKTKRGSNELVEFAVRIPGKDDPDKSVWLPIDAKFPTEDYTRLLTAYERADSLEVEGATKSLRAKIVSFAKDISSKYVDPPNTTDFAIMFLPLEGLFAEVLRIPGLFEAVQREFRVTITGPTTVSAFLSSLQMGFRSLAVERRTSDIWRLLGSVKAEFGKFGDVLEKTKQKLDAASKEIDSAGARSRAIERRLRDVESLDGPGPSDAPGLEVTGEVLD